MGIFIVIAVVAVVAGAVFLAYRWEVAIDEAWEDAARQLGLEFTPASSRFFALGKKPSRRITGAMQGVTVRVDIVRKGSGDNQTRYTRYTAAYPPLGLGLSITQSTFFRKMMKAFGSQDIQVGNADFDDAAIIKGTDPDQVAAFLDPSRTMALHRLITDYSGASIGDAAVSVRRKGVQRRSDELASMVRRVVSVGSLMSGAGPSRRTRNEALERQRRGDLARAAELLRAASTGAKGDVEVRRLEGEALYSSGRYNEATEVFARLEADLPADPWAKQWRRRSEARARLPAPPSPPKGAEAPDPIISPAVVADGVFDPGQLSFESTKVFEDRFEGKRVRWSGELQRSSSYNNDLDFDSGPGTKAVFEVHRLSVDLFGGRDVDAVVQLPPDAHEKLNDGRGEIFTFEGTLVKVDALMRNLFLEDGRLV